MDERRAVLNAAHDIASAIATRDIARLGRALAPGFVHRSPGAEAIDAASFLRAIGEIPGEIVFVTLEAIDIDVSGGSALATGVQHAQVRMDGALIDDRRAFVDWFIKIDGEWRILVAVDLPAPTASDPAISGP